jgi:hypothetical protein
LLVATYENGDTINIYSTYAMPECHCWVPARCRQVRRPMIPSLRHAGASWFAVIAPFVRNVFTSSSRRRRDVSSPHQHDIVTSVRDAFSSLCRNEMLSVRGAFPLFVKNRCSPSVALSPSCQESMSFVRDSLLLRGD